MGCELNSSTLTEEFPGILVKADPNGEAENDVFTEVHVFGVLTAFSFEAIAFETASENEVDRGYRLALTQTLQSCGVTVSIV